jgi:hypothetical protein
MGRRATQARWISALNRLDVVVDFISFFLGVSCCEEMCVVIL